MREGGSAEPEGALIVGKVRLVVVVVPVFRGFMAGLVESSRAGERPVGSTAT